MNIGRVTSCNPMTLCTLETPRKRITGQCGLCFYYFVSIFFFFCPRPNYFLGPVDFMFIGNIIELKCPKNPGTVDVGTYGKSSNETSSNRVYGKIVNVISAAEYHRRWKVSENKTGRTMQPIFVPFKCVKTLFQNTHVRFWRHNFWKKYFCIDSSHINESPSVSAVFHNLYDFF